MLGSYCHTSRLKPELALVKSKILPELQGNEEAVIFAVCLTTLHTLAVQPDGFKAALLWAVSGESFTSVTTAVTARRLVWRTSCASSFRVPLVVSGSWLYHVTTTFHMRLVLRGLSRSNRWPSRFSPSSPELADKKVDSGGRSL